MNKYKINFIVLLIILLIVYVGFKYMQFIKIEHDRIAFANFTNQVKNLQNQVSSMIILKQKSTVAMALSIANDVKLVNDIKSGSLKTKYYKNLIDKFKENTLYQNIWIQVLDKNLTSLYRSWSDKRGDNLKKIRKDLVYVLKAKKPTYSISVGKFDLSIKAIVPVFNKGNFIGIIEVISHFNSIDKQLQKSKITSVVLADNTFKKQLAYPFTNKFIDDYYVANIYATKKDMQYLKDNGIRKYLNNSYKLENGFLIVSYALKDKEDKNIGYFIMFEDIKNIQQLNLDFFVFKWISFASFFLITIMLLFSFYLFIRNRKQKYYYKNIINSSTNIVIVNDKKTILSVNDTFFKFFTYYKSLEDFKKEHNRICDLFVKDEHYLQSTMNGLNWVDYLLQDKIDIDKAKIKYHDKEYYFHVGASFIDEEKTKYSIVFTDITKEELQQKKLNEISLTDPLTKIKNRRFFDQKIAEEIERSKRYSYDLSLIMFDIDFFKNVNDIHGHDIGDKVLIEYTKLTAVKLRKNDIFCRVGGEEFMIILPYTSQKDAFNIAEKLRKLVQEHKKVTPITISLGVVQYQKDETIEELTKRVDEALYKAKRSGRNMVILA